MSNNDQLKILQQGVDAWNKWRAENAEEKIDLSRKYLLLEDLHGANLSRADLSEATILHANLMGADLSKANLFGADIFESNLSGADLSGANLSEANFSRSDISRADLSEAHLVETNMDHVILTGCKIYGISVWGLTLDNAKQNDLVITPSDEPAITVDNLEIAQFIYLILHSAKIRNVIDTITTNVVLILGRSTDERKPIIEALREELRRRNYLPVLFDFEKPAIRDISENISILAHIAKFVIADITDPKTIPAELERFVPQLPYVPVQPLIRNSDYESLLFEGISRYPWVLGVYRYEDQAELLASIEEKVIKPAEKKADELKKGLGRERCS